MKKWITAGLLISALLVCGAGYWLLATTPGLRFVLHAVVNAIPLPLTYNNLQGSILTTVRAEGAQYNTGAVAVNIEQLETGFSLMKLLGGRLGFDDVRALKVDVLLMDKKTQVPAQQDEGVDGSRDVVLPMIISLKDVMFSNIIIRNEQRTIYGFSDVTLRKAKIRENFAFQDLSFTAGPGTMSASGSLGFSPSAVVELTTAWQTRPAAHFPGVRGTASLKGTYRHFTVESQIDAPQVMALRGEVDQLFSDLAWKVNLKGDRLPLNLFRPDFSAELHGYAFDANGGLNQLNVKGRSELRDTRLGNWNAALNARFNTSQIELTALQLTSMDSSAVISIAGSTLENFTFTNGGPLKVTAAWENAQWPLSHTPVVMSDKGQLEITGSLNDYRFRLANAGLLIDGHDISGINASGQGDEKNLNIVDFKTRYLAGLWQGSGRLDWANEFAWDAAVTVKGLDPSKRWPQWPASINGTVNIHGQHKPGGWQLTGDISQVEGKFAGVPVDYAALGFEVMENLYTVKNLKFKSRQNEARGALQIKLADGAKPHINASWNINAKNLSRLLPNVKGAIISQGHLRGDAVFPQLSASIELRDLEYNEYRLDAVSGRINIDPSLNSELLVDLKLGGLAMGNNAIQRASLKGRGVTGDHELVLDSVLDDKRNLQLTARGAYANETWKGKLVSSTINTAGFGQWTQQESSDISLSLAQLYIDRYCLTPVEAKAHVCLQIRSDQFDTWKGAVNVKDLPVATFNKYFPPQVISVEGSVSGSANYFFQKNVIKHFQASLASDNGKVVYGLTTGDKQDISYERLQANITHTDQGVLVESKADLRETGIADIRATLLGKHTLSALDAAQQIQGRITVNLKTLTILPLIFTDIQYIEGRKYSEYTISGSLGNPTLTGHSDITADSVTLPRLGIELKDVKISATSDKNNNIKVAGEARSGSGKIVVNAEMPDYRSTNLLAKIRIDGENFLAVRLPEITLEVSPQIIAIVKDDELRLEGELLIPAATIQILQSAAAVSPSADVVMMNGEEKPEQPAKKLKLSAEVKVKLGHNVKLEGFGANTRLRGEVLVREDPDGATLGTGEITFEEGRYSAYNRELKIDSGTLTYASSPITNPIVAIKAMRKIDDNTRVGVMVSGYAQNPELELFSEPAMDQSDILSYMILGYPMSQASQSDGSTLSSAAGSIGLIGGEILAKQIATQFGIDDVKVTSDSTTQQTVLELGKYLSPRLYAQYAMGIGQAVNTFRIEYELTNRWMLKTEASSEQQGADLFYTIDVD